jgi:hypothetical protein
VPSFEALIIAIWITAGVAGLWLATGGLSRTVVDTARLSPGTFLFSTILKTVHA